MNRQEPKPTLLTPDGKRKLEEELQHLRDVKRPQVAERIRQAREEGDLRENAEYEDAKREQGFVEGRIQELEQLLRHVEIIPESDGNGVVSVGSTVHVREEDGPRETYTLVGPAESDPVEGRISNESPLGKALLGARKGDAVSVKTPGGKTTFHVIDVE